MAGISPGSLFILKLYQEIWYLQQQNFFKGRAGFQCTQVMIQLQPAEWRKAVILSRIRKQTHTPSSVLSSLSHLSPWKLTALLKSSRKGCLQQSGLTWRFGRTSSGPYLGARGVVQLAALRLIAGCSSPPSKSAIVMRLYTSPAACLPHDLQHKSQGDGKWLEIEAEGLWKGNIIWSQQESTFLFDLLAIAWERLSS